MTLSEFSTDDLASLKVYCRFAGAYGFSNRRQRVDRKHAAVLSCLTVLFISTVLKKNNIDNYSDLRSAFRVTVCVTKRVKTTGKMIIAVDNMATAGRRDCDA